MWIAGHAGIQGNEMADKRAKEANKEPLHTSPYFTTKDIKYYVKKHITDCCLNDWRHSNHHYKLSNPSGLKPQYSNIIPCKNIKTFIRIRIGHTLEWFERLHNTSYPRCPHLQQRRFSIFSCNKPSDLLNRTDDNNINLFVKYFQICKLNI